MGILACGYVLLNENGLVMLDDPKFFGATICMLVGSLLFFWSLSGFVITVLTRAKRIYLKGIRPFTLRQIRFPLGGMRAVILFNYGLFGWHGHD